MDNLTPTKRSRAKRLYERAAYDRDTIYAILDAGLICHVGYVIDGDPYVTPTCHWRIGDRVYWHGSSASRMLRTVKQSVPVCLTVTHFDGLVLARSGFHHSVNYRSAMIFGNAELVEGRARKLEVLEAFTERVVPGRWQELRPVNGQEIKATTVVSMVIEEASAKIRTGQPEDDKEDYALDVWAGVVPVTQVIGTPQPDPSLKPGTALPGYLKNLRLG